MAEKKVESVLGGYRVLDLTDELGVFCTKMLAGLGAEVIKVEKPGGDPMRRKGPFYKDIPDPEGSLFWFLYNLNKKSITLNLETSDGQDIFRKLSKGADFVVECFKPGYLDSLGLGYSSLSQINPRLILTSVTPFGQEGPYKDFKASELTISAAGGHAYICGDADRPPLQWGFPGVVHQAGSQAAMATMVAHFYRERTEEGQHLDVSAQESILVCALPVHLVWRSHHTLVTRSVDGPTASKGMGFDRRQFRCKDGYITCHVNFWPGRDRVRNWLATEGLAGDLLDEKWDAIMVEGAPMTDAEKEHVWELFENFSLRHTKDEIFKPGQERGIQTCPVNTVDEVLKDEHLLEREYFIQIQHPELDTTITYPGAPFIMTKAPWKLSSRAPFIGEHNEEIYMGELGFSREELAILRGGGII